jgi:general secretion pathway protein A
MTSQAMYQRHYGLDQRPFSIAPDPRYLFMSQRHREALAHLLYGVGEGGGFVQLTGEVGTGKTTLCRGLLEQLPEGVDVALILNPKVTALELIATVCDELGVSYPAGTTSTKTLTDLLNQHLLQAHGAGRHTVLVIDEAQNLSAEVLEQVRLLTNLETSREKLLQIILIGQPELRELLGREELRQLAQRVTARYHLQPLDRDETRAYIEHRIQISGGSPGLFHRRSFDRIYRLTGGVPRLINVLCDRALLGGYVEGKERIDSGVVGRAAAEVLPQELVNPGATRHWWPWGMVAAGIAVLGIALVQPWLPAPPLSAATQPAAEAPPPADGLDEPAPVDLDQLIASARAAGEAPAWRQLGARWGVNVSGTDRQQVCAALREKGLRCLSRTGSRQALRRLDRPALLHLITPESERVSVVLQAVQAEKALLAVGDQRVAVPWDDLANWWYGDYSLIWMPAPGPVTLMRLGDRGQAVAWLRDELNTATEGDPELFDARLRDAVIAFQRKEGLMADGVAGPQTLIRLNSLTSRAGVPRLSADAG